MLDSKTIVGRAAAILINGGHKPELSAQARAVIEAITEQVNQVLTTKHSRMQKPTIEEVLLLGAKSGLPDSECHRFFRFYESNGWKVGRNPMKSLAHAMGNWKRMDEPKGVNTTAQLILKQKHLDRIEDRLKFIKGQQPLAPGHKLLIELSDLRAEQTKLKLELGFKA